MKISVIVPVYKTEKYLRQCLDSLLAQDYPDYEAILVDDGSPDSCGRICDEYAANDTRVRVIHQENAGVSAARNAGVQAAKGDHITFVDSDDWVDADYLSLLLENMRPGGMAVCGIVREGGAPQKLCPDGGRTICMTKEEAMGSVLSFDGMRGYAWSKLFDRGLIIKHGLGFQENIFIHEDELFVIQYLSTTVEGIGYSKRAAYHYRIHPQSALSSRSAVTKKIEPRIFSACSALEAELQYLGQSEQLKNRLHASLIREKVFILHILEINGCQGHEKYRLYLKDVRAGLLPYLLCDTGEPAKGKARTLLCAVHPRLERRAYELRQALKGKRRVKLDPSKLGDKEKDEK